MSDFTMRAGIGYDIHRLEPGRPLVLCGVEFAHPAGLGLAGHSDADVAVHAIMDALLGAAGLGDIGSLFPSDDPVFEGASSIELLKQVVGRLRQSGLRPFNVDLVIVAEQPKIAPRVREMAANLASATGLRLVDIGVKATTAEGLGPIGEGRGISASAVATVVAV